MTEKGSTIDPKVEENIRIQSASQKTICGGFLPCNKYHFLFIFSMLFLKGSDTYYMGQRDMKNPSEKKRKIGTLH